MHYYTKLRPRILIYLEYANNYNFNITLIMDLNASRSYN